MKIHKLKKQRNKLGLKILGGFVCLLVIARIILPYVALHLLNEALDKKFGAYTGRVNTLHIALYRGAYQLRGLEIRKRHSNLPPLLYIDMIDLSLAWRSLIHKKITADITLDKATLRLIDSKTKEAKQFGNDEPKESWQNAFDLIIPISIETLKISDSNFFFSNSDFAKALPIRLENISFKTKDLRTRQKGQDLSPFKGEGLLQGHSKIFTEGKIDILSKPFRMYLSVEIPELEINTLNTLLIVYVPIDVTYGKFSLYSEMAVANGNAKGYMKVFLKNGDIIAPKQHFISVKHFIYEILGAFGNWLLENNKSKSIAMYIPFKEEKGHLDINGSKAFWSLIKNKFGRLPHGIDHSVHL